MSSVHHGLAHQAACTTGPLLLRPVRQPGHPSSSYSAPAPADSQAAWNTRQLVEVDKTWVYVPEGEFQPRLLTHHLQKASRVEQLQQLWQDHSLQFNSIHFSALMRQLAVLHKAAQTGRLPHSSNDAQEAEQLLLEWLSSSSTSVSQHKRRRRRVPSQQSQSTEPQQLQQQQVGPATSPQQPQQTELAMAQQLAQDVAAAALQPGHCEQLDGRALVMIAHSMATVGLGNAQLLHSVLQATGPNVLQQMDAQQLTNLIWSVAACSCQSRHGYISSRRNGSSMGTATISAYASNSRGPSSNIDSLQSAPSTTPAPATASSSEQFQLPRSWLEAAASVLQRQLDKCDSPGLAMAVWGFAQVGFKPDDAWWSAFWSSSQEQLSEYSGQDLALLMYACGKLKAKVPDAWLASYLSACCVVLPDLSPQQLTMAIMGLAGAGCQPHKAWLMLWCLETKTAMHRAGTQDLSMWLYSLAVLRITPSPLWCTSFVEASFDRLTAASTHPKELVTVMWAISCLSWSPPLLYWKGLMDAAAAAFNRFNSQDLANCISAVTSVDVKSIDKLWLTSFLQVSQPKLSSFLPVHLAHTARSLALILKAHDWAYACIEAPWQVAFIKTASQHLSQGSFSERNLGWVIDGLKQLAFKPSTQDTRNFLNTAEPCLEQLRSVCKQKCKDQTAKQ